MTHIVPATEQHEHSYPLAQTEQRITELAVASFIERIASLDDETRADLFEVVLCLRDCETRAEYLEIEETLFEMLSPQRIGELRRGSMPYIEEGSEANIRKRVEHIASKIKELREQNNLTQSELGEKAGGLTQSHISRLENGQHSPAFATLEKIAKALGIDVGQIDPAN